MEFRILGPLQVIDGDAEVLLGSPKERALLAVLLLEANAVVSRERLIDELWGEFPPATAAKALNVHVSQLRKALARGGDDLIATRPPGYAIEVEPEQLDAARFERLVAEARELVATGDVGSAGVKLREALALWRGRALAGVELESVACNEVGRLEELRVTAQMDRIDCDLALGLHEQLIAELEALLAEHPLRERLRGQLMLALYRSGRQADALRTYRDGRETLVGELGIEPSVPLQRLERSILNHDPSLEAPAGLIRTSRPSARGALSVYRGIPWSGPPARAFDERATLFGRDRECAELMRALGDASRGRSAVLVLRGEPGIGKSVLLREAAARAEADGFVVLHAGGVESEAELAFSGLADLLRPLLGLLSEIPERQAAALASALAVGPAIRADRFAACIGTLSLLAAVGERAPVLVTVDDVHWLDAASLDALLFVARRLEAERVALLLAVRDGAPSPVGESGLSELVVSGLDERSSRDLLAKAWPELELETAARVVATAAGNPLALLEIPALLTDAQHRGRAALDEPLPAGASIERVFLKRLAALPRESEWALLVAAASESPELTTIEAAIGPSGTGMNALERAEQAGLVLLDAGAVEFRHPLVRSAVYHGAKPGERRAAHAALAEALAGRAEERRAWHLAAAATAPDEQVASALAAAAARARERSGYAAAATAYERAAALTPDAQRRAERLLDAARSLELAGRFERVLALLQVALRETEDTLLRADIEHVRGRIEMVCGRPTDARDVFVSAAEAVVSVDRARASALLVEAAMLEFSTETKEPALATARRAFGLAAGTPSERNAEMVLRALEATWALPAEGAQATELERMLDVDDELASPELLATVVTALEHVGEGDRARRLAKRYVDRARALGAIGALPQALVAQTAVEVPLGALGAAYACALEACELATETGQLLPLAHGLVFLGWIDGYRGREDEARRTLQRAGAIMRETGWGDDVLVDYPLARMALVLGRPEEAVDLLEPVTFDNRGELRHRSAFAIDLVDAYVRTGRLDDARKTLALMERRTWPEGTFGLGVRACRGLVAPDEDFEHHFLEALGGNERAGPFYRGRAELWFGQRLRRARRRNEAKVWLHAALDRFETLGASAWAEQARAELAATGETVRRSDSAVGDLTPQELKVALAVADGATNKEAAARLFLSPKTVEFHLGRVYRKLGIRSRTELARRSEAITRQT